MKNNNTRTLTLLSIMAAFSIILIFAINIPLLPAVPFLRYDPGDIPILLAGFIVGTKEAIALSFVVAVIQGLLLSSDGGIIGMIMHFVATAIFVGVASKIYHYKNNRKFAAIGLVFGSIAMIITMVILNLLVTPIFLGINVEAVYEMLLPIIIPFNVIKVLLNSVLVWLIYRPIIRLIHLG